MRKEILYKLQYLKYQVNYIICIIYIYILCIERVGSMIFSIKIKRHNWQFKKSSYLYYTPCYTISDANCSYIIIM